MPSGTTSLPIPSPGITAIRNVRVVMSCISSSVSCVERCREFTNRPSWRAILQRHLYPSGTRFGTRRRGVQFEIVHAVRMDLVEERGCTARSAIATLTLASFGNLARQEEANGVVIAFLQFLDGNPQHAPVVDDSSTITSSPAAAIAAIPAYLPRRSATPWSDPDLGQDAVGVLLFAALHGKEPIAGCRRSRQAGGNRFPAG